MPPLPTVITRYSTTAPCQLGFRQHYPAEPGSLCLSTARCLPPERCAPKLRPTLCQPTPGCRGGLLLVCITGGTIHGQVQTPSPPTGPTSPPSSSSCSSLASSASAVFAAEASQPSPGGRDGPAGGAECGVGGEVEGPEPTPGEDLSRIGHAKMSSEVSVGRWGGFLTVTAATTVLLGPDKARRKCWWWSRGPLLWRRASRPSTPPPPTHTIILRTS